MGRLGLPSAAARRCHRGAACKRPAQGARSHGSRARKKTRGSPYVISKPISTVQMRSDGLYGSRAGRYLIYRPPLGLLSRRTPSPPGRCPRAAGVLKVWCRSGSKTARREPSSPVRDMRCASLQAPASPKRERAGSCSRRCWPVWFDCGGGGGADLSPFLGGASPGRSSVQRGVRGNGVKRGRRKGGRYFGYRPPQSAAVCVRVVPRVLPSSRSCNWRSNRAASAHSVGTRFPSPAAFGVPPAGRGPPTGSGKADVGQLLNPQRSFFSLFSAQIKLS